MHGAEKLLENSKLKNRLQQKFTSAAAKYVPSSLHEIQLGTELESAKFAKSSFNPNAVDSPKNKSISGGESAEQDLTPAGTGAAGPMTPATRDQDQKSVSKDNKNVDVSDIAMAMVLTNTYFFYFFLAITYCYYSLCAQKTVFF